eukprot:c1550_g1_i1 orf=63-3239(+)
MLHAGAWQSFHAPSHMQPSVLCKGLGYSSSSIFVRGCLLFKPTISANLSTSALSAPVGVEFHFGAQAQGPFVESCAKDGTIECKLSRDDEEILQKAIVYESERGFPNSVGRKKRFSEFLASKLSALSNANYSHADKTLTSLSNMAQSYENMDVYGRVAVLNKVCALLGFKCVQDLIDQHKALTEASKDLQMNTGLLQHNIMSNTNRTWMLQKMSHPAIVFGSSERIELFNFSNNQKGAAVNLSSVLGNVSSEDDSAFSSQRSSIANEIKGQSSSSIRNEKSLTSQVRKAKKTVKKEKFNDTYKSWLLNKPINLIESLSPTLCSRLEENGFYTLRKLLQHYPRNYLNFLQAGQTVEDGQFLTFFGKIVSARGHSAGNLGILEVLVASGRRQAPEVPPGEENSRASEGNNTVILHVKKFFRGARYSSKWFLNKLVEKYPLGAYAAVSGKVKGLEQENHFEVKDYNFELVDYRSRDYKMQKVYPVYSSKGGLDAKFFELCIHKVLPDLPLNIDPLPEKYRTAHGLMDLHKAYVDIHFPQILADAEKARQRFVFDEFFYLQLGLLLQKQELAANSHHTTADVEGSEDQPEIGHLPIEKWAPLTSKMLECLPYKLTNSQLKSVSEIMWDLQKPVPMRRLLQGDVGCGKTIVAFLALLEVIDAGFQGVLMGPTEFLAKQQYERFVAFLEHLDEKSRPQIALLTGSVPPIKARAIRKGLETGEIQLAVGTHSLIADSVKFASLGLAIVDEQHRFGVAQRSRLQNKGSVMFSGQEPTAGEEGPAVCNRRSPHVLAMTATPIPRTLAFALYGDMDLSQITELPPGRIPVKTLAMLGDDEGLGSAFEMVRQELGRGGRVFIVYAIIDESEELPNLKAATAEFERIVKEFTGYTCGLVHGKLKPNERDAAMSAFMSGESQVLVATTVIEVGIDIVEASMMVVVNAERYGMAQLHQLRGRVGRGTRESMCLLLTSSQLSLDRLKILETSNDGFHLAEVDLQLRGPGDMLGRKQSGHLAEFSLARLSEDGELMVQARKTAEEVLHDYRGLEGLPLLKQELSFRQGLDSLGV